ncbi:mitotic spindle checkpoint protein [Ascosphaera apis ARSEF 7405]|uniref:Mitotic spindle checkpoint protein n=1 Tax=Ascosphaera apis ARSEF 7405 TaxID=392613 RepID=A0A167YQF7_9EURO|nr:mitotic spindle checkpoint protein [Ascosphaera apis ARSEF 7405]
MSLPSGLDFTNGISIHDHVMMSAPTTYAELAAAVSSFLAVCIHQILYLRHIYPQMTFIGVRQFNHPVRQSRHPRVCAWITDACAAVEAQLLKGIVAKVSVHILAVRTNRALERYTFDMSQMPPVPPEDIHTPFESVRPAEEAARKSREEKKMSDSMSSKGSAHDKADDASVDLEEPSAAQPHPEPDSSRKGPTRKPPQTIDLEGQFRAVLARLASACARLTPLPAEEEYTATLQIILRPDAEPPVGLKAAEQLWIAVEPSTPALDSNGNPATSVNSISPNDDLSETPPTSPLPPLPEGEAATVPSSGVGRTERSASAGGGDEDGAVSQSQSPTITIADNGSGSGNEECSINDDKGAKDKDSLSADRDTASRDKDRNRRRISRVQTKTVPVRTVDAGEIKLEVWVEEAKNKFEELDRIYSEHPT